ncbi:MAG TPA: hypothetical protein GX707_00455 [Epulopiscium sp.]|nr:hypothetical protein [Candidatus Epulonipiscium sp.]
MILQQYYTRERRGIFRTTDGYDTIAKSPTLDKNLIKKVFHLYCFYDAPRELQVAGEKDSNKYPKSLSFIQLDTNETILGQSVYVPVDFTGQRSTFFTHNYLLSKESKEAFIKNPEKILYANEFKESYDIENGMELEAIEDLTYTKQLYDTTITNNLLNQLGITEALFKDLIVAVCLSVTSRKKVIIALDIEASDISMYARKLLLCILESLPYDIRRKVGFTSYIQKPESKKGINIMFVDKESIRHGISGVDKDFIFDFSTKRFANLKIEGELHPYLDFVWDNRGNKIINTSLYEFMDQVLSHSNPQNLVDISTYNNLSVLFQVMKGNGTLYSALKDQIFAYMHCYIDEKNIKQQITLTNLAIHLMKKELESIRADGTSMSLKFAQNLVPYYRIGSQEDKAHISSLFLFSIVNGKNTAQGEYVLTLFEMLQKSGSLINQVMSLIIGNPKIKDYILNDYISARLDQVTTIERWGKEVENLRNTAYEIIEEPYFQKESTEILLDILDKQHNIISSGKKAYNILENFSRGSSRDSRPSDIRYVEHVEVRVDEIILKNTSIKTITKNDLMYLTISPANESGKLHILYALKDLVILQEFHAEQKIKELLNMVSPVDKQEIQEAIKNLAMESPDNSFYDQLILAFYNEPSYKGEEYNYRQLLTFIFTKKGKQGVYNFIFWSLDKEGFLNKNTKSFYKGYEVAIKHYFLKLDPEAFKNKETKQRFLNIKRPRIKKLFVGINQELATGFEKLFIKYGDAMLLGIKYFVIIGMIGSAVVFGTIKTTQFLLEPSRTRLVLIEDLAKVNLQKDELEKAKEKLQKEKDKLQKEKEKLEKEKKEGQEEDSVKEKP